MREIAKRQISVHLSSLTIIINIGRPQEIYSILAPFRLPLLLLIITMLATIFSGRFRNFRLLIRKEAKLVILFLILGFITIPFSVWPGGAFAVWKVVIITNSILFFLIIMNTQTEKEVKIIINGIIISAMFLAVSMHLTGGITSDSGRIHITTSYDANDLAMVLVCTIPFIIINMLSAKLSIKLLLGSFAGIMLISILMTGSRSGFLGLAFIGIAFLFGSDLKVSKFKIIILLLCVIIGIISYDPQGLWDRFNSLFSGQDYNLGNEMDPGRGRLEIWRNSLGLFSQNMIFGVGVGQFPNAMALYANSVYLTAHNSIIQIAIELGFGGFLIFITIIYTMWKNDNFIQENNYICVETEWMSHISKAIKFSMIGYLVCGFFISQAYFSLLYILLAISFSLKNQLQNAVPNSYIH